MADSIDTGRTKVLLVDDEQTILSILSKILEGAGFLCDRALSGGEALAFLRTGVYFAAVIDYRMQDMTGLELAGQIKKDPRNRDLYIILMSGALPAHLFPVIENTTDVDEFMNKPVQSKALIERLRNLTGGREQD